MKCIYALILSTGLSISMNAATIYVDQNASGNNNGSSWSNAYTDLQTAINNAAANDVLFVKSGTYYPTYQMVNNDARTKTFYINKNIKIYGSFNGTETTLGQRNLLTNPPTILSGDFNGNDSDTNGNGINDYGLGENAYNVVFTMNLANTALLDGFRITGGNADVNTNYTLGSYTIYKSVGGGMYNINSKIQVKNSRFVNNSVYGYGGAMECVSASNVTVDNCTFTYNAAAYGACVGLDNASSAIITNSTFTSNRFTGGCIASINYSVAKVSYSTFNNNSGTYGGAIYGYNYGNSVLQNVKIHNNSASSGGGAIYNNGNSTNSVYNSLIYSNSADTGGAIKNVGSSYSNIVNCTITKNFATGYGGAIYCSVAPDNMNSKIYNNIIWGNTSNSQFSPYIYYEYFTPTKIHVKNSIIQGSGGSSNWYSNWGLNEGGNLDTDPKFTNSAANDFSLLSVSPAINSASNDFLTLPTGNDSWYAYDTDIMNNPRLVNALDMGSIENQTVLSTHENQKQNDFQVFPVPAKDFINFKSQKKINTITILDISGKIIKKETQNFEKGLNISNLDAGVYFVNVVFEDHTERVGKIIKD